jgi:hypothetical protein
MKAIYNNWKSWWKIGKKKESKQCIKNRKLIIIIQSSIE